MEQLIQELIDILEQETGLYEDILKIARNKTDIIVKGKVSDLESITQLEQSLVLQMGRLETRREELVGQLSKQLGIKPADIHIGLLLKHISNAQADKLKRTQNRLSGTLVELKESNQLNSKLIKNSLEYIDFSVNLLTGAGPQGNNYGSTGQVDDPKKRNFFDIKL